jgi:hypothetical protein
VQVNLEVAIPAYDEDGRFVPITKPVRRPDHPELCANATAGSDSAKATQKTLTAMRALRLAARIGLALRMLRAVVKISKMAQLLGGDKGKAFDGHDRHLTDVVLVPPAIVAAAAAAAAAAGGQVQKEGGLREEERLVQDANSKDETNRWRLFTAAADGTIHAYDVLGIDTCPRRAVRAAGERPSGGGPMGV